MDFLMSYIVCPEMIYLTDKTLVATNKATIELIRNEAKPDEYKM